MKQNTRTAVLAAHRTAIGRFLGSLAPLSAADLGATLLPRVLERAGVPATAVDEVIVGSARQAGGGPNVARQILIRAGLPQEVTAFTVNMACASGLKSIALAHQAIALGEADVVVAAGVESMSRVPYLLPSPELRQGLGLGSGSIEDAMYRDGFFCPLADQLMGATAENLVDRYEISREEQDEYAARSQNRAEEAWARERFIDEIIPVELPDGSSFDRDEHPRNGVTAKSLGRLRPVFRKEGSVTAGNSCGITDGAAAMVLASEAFVAAHGLRALAWIEASSQVGVDPCFMGIGPAPATQRLLDRTGLTLPDIDLIEVNEAFAAQVLAVGRELPLDWERVNKSGGAIALGHPIGCTGVRIAVTLLHEMLDSGAERGIATLCVSGGLGMSVLFRLAAGASTPA